MLILQATSILMLIIIILIILISIVEIRKLNITRYTISNKKIPKEFNGYKLILMSDLHNCFYSADKILQIIKEEKPNGVIIAGDMLVFGESESEKNIKSLEFIKNISKYADIYYAPGNHEMAYMVRKNKEWLQYEKQIIDEDNIYYLDNKKIEITLGNSSLMLYGLHLTDGYYKRFIKKSLEQEELYKLLEKPDDKTYNILIAHNPDYFNIYSEWGADLVLSGHNHGGLIKLPIIGGVISPRLRLFPKYDYGIFNNNESTLVLSGGLGAHSLKIRVNNRPELVVIKLQKG